MEEKVKILSRACRQSWIVECLQLQLTHFILEGKLYS